MGRIDNVDELLGGFVGVKLKVAGAVDKERRFRPYMYITACHLPQTHHPSRYL